MPLHLRLENGILVVDMANPPVNCLSLELRRELHTVFTVIAADPLIAALVLCGSGKYFCAGGDLKELGTALGSAAPRLSADILPAIERCPKPVIAAIHGGAIGGGFELALACHYRVALDDARIALPEVQHGIIPLSGTIRLPRLLGISRAVPMIVDATAMSASDFAGSAVFDVLKPSDGTATGAAQARLLSVTMAFVRAVVLADTGPVAHLGRLVRNRPFVEKDPRRVLSETLAHYAARVLTPAQAAAIDAIRAGIEMSDFDAALANSQRLYDQMVRSQPPRSPAASST